MGQRVLRPLLRIVLAIALAGLLAGLLGGLSPLLDLANLARVPLALLAALAAAGMAWLARRRWKKAGFALLALAGLALLLPPEDAPRDCPPGAPTLRLAWLNAHGTNDPAPITTWLEAERPDLVALGEVGPDSPRVLAAVQALYPFSQSCHRTGHCSTLLFARIPPTSAEPLARGDADNRRALSAVRMRFAHGEAAPLGLIALHLSRPLPLGRQRAELAELAGLIEGPADSVIVGDFNATRRMATLAGFARSNGFAMSAADGPTWPVAGPPGFGLIQIDQLLLGHNWGLASLRRATGLGSDHAGLVADICRRA